MKKQTFKYNGHEYDSKEEIEFVMWLEEAKKAGFVLMYKHHPLTIEAIPKQTYPDVVSLKTKSKLVDKFLLHPLSYTPDFEIIFDEHFFSCFDSGLTRIKKLADNSIITNYLILYADVKGTYNLQNHHRIFSLTQKIVYDKTGWFINMVTPDSIIRKGKIVKAGFFSRTWVPEGCAWMKNRIVPTRRKTYSDCKLLSEIKIKSPIQEQQTRIEL